jgi:DNA modification methylase
MNDFGLTQDPYYATEWGAAYLADSLELIRSIPDGSVNLVVTSPPFALQRKKQYGNVDASDYVAWFKEFAREFYRVLTDDGSVVVDLGGSWVKGQPTRNLYQFELVIDLCKNLYPELPQQHFYLAEEFFWYNPARLPSPDEWVNVRRIRVKDAVDTVWWLSKTPNPKASNRNVLQPYSDSMQDLLKNGYRAKMRPSGHDISANFSKDNGGAIPSNLLQISNTESNSRYQKLCREAKIAVHPARFPAKLPEFFIKFLTDPGDLVIDPFAGSNVTGEVCERLKRRWIGIEIVEEYLRGSRFRFHGSLENQIDQPNAVTVPASQREELPVYPY